MGFGRIKKAVKKAAKSTWNNRTAVAQTAVQGYNLARKLQGLINVEKKYLDRTISTNVAYHALTNPNLVNWNGHVYELSNLAQGDTSFDRGGNSVLCKGFNIRGIIRLNSLLTSSVIRVMVVLDTMNQSGTAPTAADIITNTGSAGAPSGTMQRNKSPRYKILWSKLITMSDSGRKVVTFKHYKKLNLHMKYTGPLESDAYKNQLYLVHVSDTNVNDSSIDMMSRVYYYDN